MSVHNIVVDQQIASCTCEILQSWSKHLALIIYQL